MIPAQFDYVAPTSLEEALAALAESDDAKVIAGGQSLLPVLRMRLNARAGESKRTSRGGRCDARARASASRRSASRSTESSSRSTAPGSSSQRAALAGR